jgi:succinylarginine dihydrolase
MDLGLIQGILPPQERPVFSALRNLGFRGSDEAIMAKVAKTAPYLLSSCSSSVFMYAANAATVAPSADTKDGRVHFTPANLVSKFHRSLETRATSRTLQVLFPGDSFIHHRALPSHPLFGDEGAANHTRFCDTHSARGVHFFVYGRIAVSPKQQPQKFPARQTKEACEALARLHKLSESQLVFAQQNPKVIDSGVFHNDVISVGNENIFFLHEKAFLDQNRVLKELQKKFSQISGKNLEILLVKDREVSVSDAVKSYLFNSQLVTLPDGKRVLICPEECRKVPAVRKYLERITGNGSIVDKAHFLNVLQAMQNGGGPACLRLRVVLTEDEKSQLHRKALLTPDLYQVLCNWIRKHYRDKISPEDLADPHLLRESRTALDELTQILELGSHYLFQRLARSLSR